MPSNMEYILRILLMIGILRLCKGECFTVATDLPCIIHASSVAYHKSADFPFTDPVIILGV